MKLDKRLTNRIVLDTETTRKHQWVNDIAWLVTNKYGTICEKRFLIRESFVDDTPFNLHKIDYYNNLIAKHEVPVVSIDYAIEELLNDMVKYDADVYAYNCNFDFDHINKTLTETESELLLTESFKDIWGLAYDSIIARKSYARKVYESEWFTDKGNPKMSAEMVYRFISENDEFTEDHTALSDIEIELVILQTALSKHCKRRYTAPTWIEFKKYCESLGYGI